MFVSKVASSSSKRFFVQLKLDIKDGLVYKISFNSSSLNSISLILSSKEIKLLLLPSFAKIRYLPEAERKFVRSSSASSRS